MNLALRTKTIQAVIANKNEIKRHVLGAIASRDRMYLIGRLIFSTITVADWIGVLIPVVAVTGFRYQTISLALVYQRVTMISPSACRVMSKAISALAVAVIGAVAVLVALVVIVGQLVKLIGLGVG